VRAWRTFLLLAGLILVVAIVGVQLLVPAPPKRVRIAAGAEEGMYMDAARRYRDILARDGVERTIVATSGSIENLGLLAGRRRRVDRPERSSGGGRRAPAAAGRAVATAWR
jgi:TRAP-type uncharacterized transport system substrate-binding protein